MAEVVTLIERIDAVRHGSNDIAAVRQGLAGVARLRGWLDGCEADLAAATIGRVPVPVETIAESAKISQRAADRVIERHGTATDVPSFGEALIDGDVSGGHVDALTAGIRSLEPAERHGFRQHVAGLVEQAKSSTVEEFRALVQAEARRFSADHGEERLARQKRACRLRSWVSPSDGMWKLSGSFDPQTGLTLHGRLSAAVSRLFHQSVPDDAPDDPGERADFLRAQALLALTAGSVAGAGAGRAEILPVIHISSPCSSRSPRPSPDADPAMAPTRHEPSFPPGPCQAAAGGAGSRSEHPQPHAPQLHASEPDVSDPRVARPPAAVDSLRPGASLVDRSPPDSSPPDSSATITSAPAGSSSFGSNGSDQDPGAATPLTRSPDSGESLPPHIEWGIPVELPWSVLRQLFEGGADTQPVIVCNGVVLHAPGELNLGRSTRLANRAQRRALRALYPCCAMPGCTIGFDHTQPHHIVWWEHGGTSNFDNLVPLCSRHHHLAHEGGWHLRLDASRMLRITYPGGTTETTAPPGSRTGRLAA